MKWESFENVLFDFDKSDIRASEREKVDKIARYMKENADFDLGLDGYADQRGSSAYNRRLSDRRVKTVADALAAAGVPAARMKSGAFGEERALCAETTEECYQRNRRVEVFVRPRGK